jgi:subtilisin family serine protease
MSEQQALRMADDPRVEFVEEDARVNCQPPRKTGRPPGDWIALTNAIYRSTEPYNYFATGTGVTAYIIDTGIRATHTPDCRTRNFRLHGGSTTVMAPMDCNGHGTHVSGTVGGTTYGVAKNVTLVAVRVLDCSGNGTNSGVIAGVDWVTSKPLRGTTCRGPI